MKTTDTNPQHNSNEYKQADSEPSGLHALARLLETAPSIDTKDHTSADGITNTSNIPNSSQVEAALTLVSASKDITTTKKQNQGPFMAKNKTSSYWIEWPTDSGVYAHILARQNFPQRVIMPRIPPMASLLFGKLTVDNMLNLSDSLPSKRTAVTLKLQPNKKNKTCKGERTYECQLVLFHKTKNSPINMTNMTTLFKDHGLRVGDVLRFTPDSEGAVKVDIWKWNSAEGLEIKEMLNFDQVLEDRKMEETKNRKKKRNPSVVVEEDEDDEDDEYRVASGMKKQRKEILDDEKYTAMPSSTKHYTDTSAFNSAFLAVQTVAQQPQRTTTALDALSGACMSYIQIHSLRYASRNIPRDDSIGEAVGSRSHVVNGVKHAATSAAVDEALMASGKMAFDVLEKWYRDQHILVELASRSDVCIANKDICSSTQLGILKEEADHELRKKSFAQRLNCILNSMHARGSDVAGQICDAALALSDCLWACASMSVCFVEDRDDGPWEGEMLHVRSTPVTLCEGNLESKIQMLVEENEKSNQSLKEAMKRVEMLEWIMREKHSG